MKQIGMSSASQQMKQQMYILTSNCALLFGMWQRLTWSTALRSGSSVLLKLPALRVGTGSCCPCLSSWMFVIQGCEVLWGSCRLSTALDCWQDSCGEREGPVVIDASSKITLIEKSVWCALMCILGTLIYRLKYPNYNSPSKCFVYLLSKLTLLL